MAAPRPSPSPSPPPRVGEPYPWVIRLLRHFDFALLALALPVFVATDIPLLGWAAAAVAWTCQRVVRAALERRAEASDDPRTVAGIAVGSMMARAWLMALTIVGVGISDREAGLSAAILAIVLFTAFFSTQLALRPFDRRPAP